MQPPFAKEYVQHSVIYEMLVNDECLLERFDRIVKLIRISWFASLTDAFKQVRLIRCEPSVEFILETNNLFNRDIIQVAIYKRIDD